MVAGADCIDDMALLRHGAMSRVFDSAYAPSTLGSFLRSFTFGHVRQLDAVASRFLAGLGRQAPVVAEIDEYALVDVDDTIIEVHGYAKQGAGFGCTKVRGLNALIATITTSQAAPEAATRLEAFGSEQVARVIERQRAAAGRRRAAGQRRRCLGPWRSAAPCRRACPARVRRRGWRR